MWLFYLDSFSFYLKADSELKKKKLEITKANAFVEGLT